MEARAARGRPAGRLRRGGLSNPIQGHGAFPPRGPDGRERARDDGGVTGSCQDRRRLSAQGGCTMILRIARDLGGVMTTFKPAFKQIASGLRFPEGPVAMPDGSVILVEIERRTLSRVTPDGKVHVIASLGGGPNGAAMGPGGKIYVTNNGGLKFVDRPGKLF